MSLPDAGVAAAAVALAAATPFRPGSAPGDLVGPAAGAPGPRIDTGTLSISSVEEGPEGSPAATLTLLPEQDAGATDQPALPFQPAPPGAALPPSMIAQEPVAAEERAGSGTLALSLDDDWTPAAGAPGPSGASEDGALAASPAHAEGRRRPRPRRSRSWSRPRRLRSPRCRSLRPRRGRCSAPRRRAPRAGRAAAGPAAPTAAATSAGAPGAADPSPR